MATNNRLKAARVLKGFTQLQLAEKLGAKEIEISRIETGRARPNDEMKRRLLQHCCHATFHLVIGSGAPGFDPRNLDFLCAQFLREL